MTGLGAMGCAGVRYVVVLMGEKRIRNGKLGARGWPDGTALSKTS